MFIDDMLIERDVSPNLYFILYFILFILYQTVNISTWLPMFYEMEANVKKKKN